MKRDFLTDFLQNSTSGGNSVVDTVFVRNLMLKLCLTLSFLFFMSLSLSIHADIQKKQEWHAAQALLQFLSPIKTLKAHFLQIQKDNKGKILQKVAGEMLLKKPDKFLWHITYPQEQWVITKANQLIFYDKDLQQVNIKKNQSDTVSISTALLAQDAQTLLKHFYICRDNSKFILKPRSSDTGFLKAILYFQQQKINKIEIQDFMQRKTEIYLQDIQQNMPLSNQSFMFHIPSEVDVMYD